MPDREKTPLELALERQGTIEYCDECEYLRVVNNTAFCGLSGKLLHPMMFVRGLGAGPARRCKKRKEALDMGLTGADLARMGPAAQRQVMEKLGITGKTKPVKYHNEKAQRTMPNGTTRTFDSQKEARRYDELLLLLNAGEIRNLALQKQFTIQESYITADGERVRAIRYVADFAYERKKVVGQSGVSDPIGMREVWTLVVEDAKGVRTKDYNLKKKLLRERFGISITEV